MNAPAKLAAFAVAVVAAFAVGYGTGEVVGPFDGTPDAPGHDVHQMEDQ